MGKKVTAIPATISRFTAAPITAQKKRKVAGYARVSTDHDDQFTSYEAQIDYYTNYIKSREDWEFIKVYTDEGITGTSTKKRKGFINIFDSIKKEKISNLNLFQAFYLLFLQGLACILSLVCFFFHIIISAGIITFALQRFKVRASLVIISIA